MLPLRPLSTIGLPALRPLKSFYDQEEEENPYNEMTPEEEQGTLQSLASKGLAGLSAVANTLDTFGGGVRAALVGRNPLMGAASWDPADRPTGRDVLREWGMVGPEDNWGNFLGGMALEIATDPLSYLSFGLKGALTKAGKVAERLGILGNIRQVASKKARGLLEGRAKVLQQTQQGLTREQAVAAAAKEPGMISQVGNLAASTQGKMAGSRWARMRTTVGDLMDDAAEHLPADQFKKLSDDLADEAARMGTTVPALRGQVVGGQVGMGLPFMGRRAAGQWGDTGTTWLSNKLDSIGNSIRFGELPVLWSPTAWWNKLFKGQPLPSTGISPGRIAHQLFNPAVRGIGSTEGQIAAQGVRFWEDANRAAGLGKGFRAMEEAQELLDATDAAGNRYFTDQTLNETLRSLLERKRGGTPGSIAREVDARVASLPQPLQAKLNELANGMWIEVEAQHQRHIALGMRAPDLVDTEIDYFPRYIREGSRGRTAGGAQLFDPRWEATMGRREFLKDIPDGTAALDRMQRDPMLVGPQKLRGAQAMAYIKSQYKVTNKDALEKLSGMFGGLPDDALSSRGMYGSTTHDYTQYLVHGGARAAHGQGALDFIVRNAQEAGTPGTRTVGSLLEGVDFTGQHAGNAIAYLARKLGVTPDEVLRMGIPEGLAREATQLIQKFKQPTALNPLAGAIDTVGSLWKTSLTSPWPAFHVRNWWSGLVQNILGNSYDPKVHAGVRAMLREGKPIAGSAQWPAVQRALKAAKLAPTDENAMRILQQMAFQQEVIGRYHGMQHVGEGFDLPEEFGASIPGRRPWRWGERLGEARQRLRTAEGRTPWAVRGVGGRMETEFAPARLGEDIGWLVESENRLTPFFSLMKRGSGDAAAGSRARQLQVDYGTRQFTDFENTVMKRLFPFYGFNSRMGRYLVGELAREPGGRLANMVRASNRMQDPATVLPEYLQQGLAIPLGQNPQGGPRVLGGLSMMHEPAAAMLGPLASMALQTAGMDANAMGRAARQVFLEGGGQLNPLIKFPIEWAQGRSFFQRGPEGGRELSEQDPLVGRIIANLTGQKEAVQALPPFFEALLANSPLSRLLSTTRTITDPRKLDPLGLPLLASVGGGFRVTDVTPEAQESIIREMAQARLAETGIAKQYEQTYIPLEVLKQLDPNVWEDAIAYNAILKKLAKRAHARARGKKLEPLGAGSIAP